MFRALEVQNLAISHHRSARTIVANAESRSNGQPEIQMFHDGMSITDSTGTIIVMKFNGEVTIISDRGSKAIHKTADNKYYRLSKDHAPQQITEAMFPSQSLMPYALP